MVFDPLAQTDGAVAHIADINLTLSHESWYLGLLDSSLADEMEAVAQAIKSISKGIFLKDYGAEEVPPLFSSKLRLEKLHLVIDGVHFSPGSRRLQIGLAIVASVVGITAGATSIVADYPDAKKNLPELQKDVKAFSEDLSRKISEYIGKIPVREGEEQRTPDLFIETSWRRGYKDLGKLLIDNAGRNTGQ
ncbi:hypothetical protein [Paracoccus everestensis]|uniref:hypothetical protein n=1 Tax=Paracoccus everestensis TaxID=2903900 RepID=UPI001F3C9B45|nr:hypothetical protein [Paracoccus everestensis]